MNYLFKKKHTCLTCKYIRYDLKAVPFCDGIGRLEVGAEHQENNCKRWKEGGEETQIQILKNYETEELSEENN